MRPRFPTFIFLMMALTITAILLISCAKNPEDNSGAIIQKILSNFITKVYNYIVSIISVSLVTTNLSIIELLNVTGKLNFSFKAKDILKGKLLQFFANKLIYCTYAIKYFVLFKKYIFKS